MCALTEPNEARDADPDTLQLTIPTLVINHLPITITMQTVISIIKTA